MQHTWPKDARFPAAEVEAATFETLEWVVGPVGFQVVGGAVALARIFAR